MIEFIQSLSSPYLIVFLLGLVFVLDPCTLLSNIAAIGYISKDYTSRGQVVKNYIFFVIGRFVTLGLFGFVLVVLFKESVLLLKLQNLLSAYNELIMAVFFVIIGLLLIFADRLSFLKINFSTEKIERHNINTTLQSFLLGSVISLILCPTNIVLFFAILIPLSVGSVMGLFLPFIFSLSSTLPIVMVVIIMIVSLNSIDKFYKLTDKISKYIVKISGGIFLMVGLYMLVGHLFFHYHH